MKTEMKRLLSFVAVLAMVFSMVPVFHLPTIAATEVEQEAAQPVRFPSDVETYEAECPVCKATATWKPYNGEHYSESTVLKTASHFYLTEDKTYASGKSFLSSWKDVCFNLNGYNITAEVGAYATFSCTRKLNLMDTYGGSVVTGYANKSTSAAVLSVNGGGASAAYHLYGGTYRKLAEDTQAPIVHIRPNGGTVTVHDGAVIDDRNAGEAVKISGGINTSGTVLKATFDVRGGEVKGNITVGVSGASSAGCAAFNMYSGTITGNVTVNNGAAFSAGGGTITGTVTAASGTTVTLSGAPKLPGGLSLGDGVVADITALTKDARIAIKASEVGVKLTTPRDDATTLKGVFSGDPVQLGEDNCFYTSAGSAVRFPSDVASYEAECPICKTSVTWKPYNGEHYSEGTVLKTASHLYLTEDKTYGVNKNFLVSWRDVCFNLNGYNITAEVGAKPAFGCTKRLNLIDTYGGSVVTGYANKSSSGAALHVNGANAAADYHIYGGTYRKLAEDSQSPTVRISNNGGTVAVYDGAVIESGNTGKAVSISGSINASGVVQKATLHVRGGEVKGNMTMGVSGASSAGCAAFSIYSGTITGNVTINNGAAFSAGGGTLSGTVTAASGTTVTLSGAPKLTGGLSLGSDVVADITALTKDARIAIKASEVGVKLTTPRDDAATLKGVFSGDPVRLGEDNCFYTAEGGAPRFPSGVESYVAICPACKEEATWKPYNGEHYSDSTILKTASHFYLTEDKTYASGKNFLASWRDVCFNLNGYNITAEVGASAAFSCTRKLNLMDTYGGSVVTGYANKSTSGAVLNVNGGGASADCHLYGGIYRKLTEDTLSPIVHIRANGGTVTVHDGAVIDNRNADGAVKISGSINASGKVLKATFDVRGGEVKGNITVGVSGSSYAGCAELHVYSGTITGNVAVNNGADFSVHDGTISGTVTAASGTTVSLSGAPKLGGLSLGSGVIADITALTKDASIVIETSEAGAKLTSPREDAAELKNVFSGDPILLGADNCFYSFTGSVAIVLAEQVAFYETADEAVAAYVAENGFANGSVLVLGKENLTITLAGDAYVDAAGFDVTVGGTGKLYGMDRGNADYKAYARWNLGGDVTAQTDVVDPVSGYRYIFAEGGYHRIDLVLTHVTLRTAGDPGMYYKALIACDETLANLIGGYGTALSLKAIPGADFAEKEDVKYTAFGREDFTALYRDHQVATNSCTLVGILKDRNSQRFNASNANRKVYANLYVKLQLGNQQVTLLGEGFGCSMLDLMHEINDHWGGYAFADRDAFKGFVKRWTPHVQENTFPALRNEIQVGFGRTDITPDYSVPLAGYGSTSKRMSTGVASRIYASCVAITENDGNTLLLISQDLIGSGWAIPAQEAISAATGVPAENIMISATHTHAAPDTNSSLDVIQLNYKEDYLAWITEAAVAAMADRSPAMAYTAETTLEKMNSVRHYLMSDGTYAGDNFGSFTNNSIVEPAAESDKQYQLIRFAREGKPAVVMANWQAHVTYDTGGTLISSSFVGITREHFEENTGDLFVYFTGDCGNINPESYIVSQNRFNSVTDYGQILSQEAIALMKTMDAGNLVEFGVKSMTFTGQINHDMEDKLEQAKEVQAVNAAQGQTAATKLAKSYGFSSVYHCNGVVRRSAYGQTMDIPLTVFYLGDISFVAAPYEMFAAHGMYIKENTPGTTFLLTSCNGKYGYLPTNEAYDYGCYESHTGNFARGTGDQLAQAYVDMLNELAGAQQ